MANKHSSRKAQQPLKAVAIATAISASAFMVGAAGPANAAPTSAAVSAQNKAGIKRLANGKFQINLDLADNLVGKTVALKTTKVVKGKTVTSVLGLVKVGAGGRAVLTVSKAIASGMKFIVALGTKVLINAKLGTIADAVVPTPPVDPTPTDSTAPTVAITDDVTGTASGPVTYTFTFSEAVTGFTADDVTVTGGTKGAFSGSGSVYTLVVTPNANSTEHISVSLSAGAAADAAGNSSVAGSASTQHVDTVPVDSTAPTLSITDNTTGIAVNDVTYTFTFSETVTGFTADDVVVTGGTKGAFSGSGSSYSLVVTPAANSTAPLAVSVAPGAAKDAAGNSSSAAAAADQAVDTKPLTPAVPSTPVVTTPSDTTAPVITISDNVSGTATGDVTYTFTFSEAVTDFVVGDVTIVGGDAGTFTAVSSTEYTLLVTPNSNATEVRVSILAGATHDAASNGNVTTVATVQAVSNPLTDAIAAAESAKTAYTAAGGSATDQVYVDVVDALAANPRVTATITAATSALTTATTALTDAAAALAAAVTAAESAKTAYTAAGGSATDQVYVDVVDALAANPRVTATITAATSALTTATTALTDAAAALAAAVTAAESAKTAYTAAGGSATDQVYVDVVDALAANPRVTATITAATSALTTATTALTDAAAALAAAVTAAESAKTAYTAAGGSATDQVYVDVVDALAANPRVTATITAATSALTTATTALTDAAAALAAAVTAAESAKTAYTAAGGSATDQVYVDVVDALAANPRVTATITAATSALTTATTALTDAAAALAAAVTAAESAKTAYTAAGGSATDQVYVDVVDALAANPRVTATITAATSALTTATTALTDAAAALAAAVTAAESAKTAYTAAGGSATDQVYVDVVDALAANPRVTATITAATSALTTATTALTDAAAALAAAVTAAESAKTAYTAAGGSATDQVYVDVVDALAANPRVTATITAATSALTTATTALTDAAAALAAAVTAAESAKTAYTAAGGSATDQVYVDVVDALAANPRVTATITAATSALTTATTALTDAAAALAAAVTAAESAKTAYTAAGGSATDQVYVDVVDALAANPRVTATITAATSALTTATTALTDAAAALAAAVTAAESAKTAYTAAGGSATDQVYVDVVDALAANPRVTATITAATSALTTATTALTDAAAALAAAVTAAESAKTAYTAAGGSATDQVYVDVVDALAANPRVTATITAATSALTTATTALTSVTITSVNGYLSGDYVEVALSPSVDWNSVSSSSFAVYGIDSNSVETQLIIQWIDIWNAQSGGTLGHAYGLGIQLFSSLSGYSQIRVVYTFDALNPLTGSGKTLRSFDEVGSVQ